MEEKALQLELATLKTDSDKVQQEVEEQISAKEKLEIEEEKYWQEYSKYKRELVQAEDAYKSSECKVNYLRGKYSLNISSD